MIIKQSVLLSEEEVTQIEILFYNILGISHINSFNNLNSNIRILFIETVETFIHQFYQRTWTSGGIILIPFFSFLQKTQEIEPNFTQIQEGI